jgi:thioredoxin 1
MPPMNTAYAQKEPTLADIEAMAGPALLEFGTPWCGYCRAAQPLIAGALASHEQVRHVKVEDGSGRPLGRHFGVKLWPTLVMLKDGREVARLVRPSSLEAVQQALDQIGPAAA